ncbi:MAG: hypothetical protein M3O82_09450 [Verrucomicrobiota bacterium]|nr:hypothetical protein [Verrucomicrobiota bacterium]
MVKPIGIISSDPKGVFDKMAAAYVQHMRLQAFTTGTHVGTPKLELHVLFYTITKPKYVVGVANLLTDYVKAHELTPSLKTALINEAKTIPPLPIVPR